MATLKLVKDKKVSQQTKPPHISTVANIKSQSPVKTVLSAADEKAVQEAQAVIKAHSEASAASLAYTTNQNIIELVPFMACACREIDFDEAVATAYAHIYVKTANGWLKHMKLKGGRHIRLKVDALPNKAADPFPNTKLIVEELNFLPAGKIPFDFFNQIVQFFRAVMKLKKADYEAHAWILWEPEKGYYISIPKQSVGKASVTFSYDNEALPPNAVIVVDIHSHNTMGAFYSGTDNNNDKTGVYYSGVIGKLTEKSYEWVMRFNNFEQKKNVVLEEIFDMEVEVPDVPQNWLDNVVVEAPRQVGYGTYFPKGGNTTQDVSRMGKGSERGSSGQTGSGNSSQHYTNGLWEDLHSDSYDQYFGERPTGRTLMPGAKPNAEIKPPHQTERFVDWQNRMQKLGDNRADGDLVDEEFDRAQMAAELAQRHGDNRAGYYTALQDLARLSSKLPESGIVSLAHAAEQEHLENQIRMHVSKMTPKDLEELGLSEMAEAWLEKYHSQKGAPTMDTLTDDENPHANWPYSAVNGPEDYEVETEVRLGKGSFVTDGPTDDEALQMMLGRTAVGLTDGIDPEECNFPDGDDFNTVAAEFGLETANHFAIIDTIIVDLEGYDAGLKEIMNTAYQLMSERAQAQIQMNGLGS